MPEPQPAFQFVDLRQQHDVAQLGMWVFLATEVLFFGGLILAYCVYRAGYTAGFAEAARHTRIVIGTANTAVLLTSSFLVAWAVMAARLRDGRLAAILLWIAAALGVLFLVLKGVEYHGEYDEHLVPGLNFDFGRPQARPVSLFFTFYFVATGLHGVHVAIGIIVLGVIGLRAWQGAYSDRYHAPITVAALYWHFVDVVWIFLFALIYLPGEGGVTKRYPPRILVLSWAGLLVLLGLTVFAAYLPLGAFNTAVAMAIALGKALIVAAIFMELRERHALTIIFAGAGFFWLAIMLWLALADYLTRPNFPPTAPIVDLYGLAIG